MITMMGAAGSGKTSLLVALYYEIVTKQEKDQAWRMAAVNPRAERMILDGYQSFINRSFPAPNLPQTERAVEPLRFRLSKPVVGFRDRLRSGGVATQAIDLDLLDPSGEYFSHPQRFNDDNIEANTFRNTLTNSTGLICLIDPDSEAFEYFPLLFENFTLLSTLMNGDGGGKIDVPVAVCVAKADQHREAFDDARGFLRRRMGRVAFGVLVTYCEEMAFFATSAVGNNVERDAEGHYVPTAEPEPMNVLAPFEWLIDRQ